MTKENVDLEGSKKVYWFADSETNKKYETSTFLRVMKIEKFVKEIEKGGHKIVGITFEGNLLGFILGEGNPKHDN